MPTIDPLEVEEFADRVNARQGDLDAYRDSLRDAAVDSTGPFGGPDAPWSQDMSDTWDEILDRRVTDCDNASGAIEQVYFNLLHTAAVWREADGQSEDDFNGTGASLEEHAAGKFFESW